jgi:hypothetical protein
MTAWRFRANWRGLLILQRRVRIIRLFGSRAEPCLEWRDATAEDMAEYYRDLYAKGGN